MNQKEFTRAYLSGYTGRRNGEKEKDNPYSNKPSKTLLRDQWMRGWIAASGVKKVEG